ncbi:hypothetical protein G3A_11390 [Bacillus sp. 17376]|nr:hypothetical protein G3A_11390 [Bacillus sp. 17376]
MCAVLLVAFGRKIKNSGSFMLPEYHKGQIDAKKNSKYQSPL